MGACRTIAHPTNCLADSVSVFPSLFRKPHSRAPLRSPAVEPLKGWKRGVAPFTRVSNPFQRERETFLKRLRCVWQDDEMALRSVALGIHGDPESVSLGLVQGLVRQMNQVVR